MFMCVCMCGAFCRGQPLSTFRWRRVLYYTLGALRILPAFIVLSLCYCLWFVFMKYFNDLYRLNAWGFNSYDQVGGSSGVVGVILRVATATHAACTCDPSCCCTWCV